jgi:ribonuclease HI
LTKSPDIHIYTDGSCSNLGNESVGAWAAIVFVEEEKTVLKDVVCNTTHNRMELLAVIKAIDFLKSKNLPASTCLIYSDSQYVVQLKERGEKLKNKDFKTSKGTPIQNEDLVRVFLDLISVQSIEFVKVKAHQKKGATINYNREVDMLSRKLVRAHILES